MFLIENEEETRIYSERLDSNNFISEMVTASYSEDNLNFAKALQEAYDEEYLLNLNPEDKKILEEKMLMLEDQISSLRHICSLQEGFGIISWWKRHATGTDFRLEAKVRKKLSKIKTQKQKDKIVSDLEKVVQKARAISGLKDTNEGRAWKDLKTGIQTIIASGGPLPTTFMFMIIRVIRSYNGSIEEFIKVMETLINDVKSVKVSS